MPRCVACCVLVLSLAATAIGQVAPASNGAAGAATRPASQPFGLQFRAHPPNALELVVAAARSRPMPAGSGIRNREVVPDLISKTIKFPLPIYDMTLADVSGRNRLDRVQTTVGFLYHVDDAAGQTEAAMNVVGDDRAAVRVAMIEYRPRAQRYAQAIALLETLPEVRAGAFEPRLLRFNFNSMIWLKDQTGNADLIYPLAPRSPGDPSLAGLTAEKLITAEQFIRIVTSTSPASPSNPPAP